MNSLIISIDRMEDIGENPTSPLRRDSLGREQNTIEMLLYVVGATKPRCKKRFENASCSETAAVVNGVR